jgi:NADPH:quinone reductase-like Zn-dependent oxidoreductase
LRAVLFNEHGGIESLKYTEDAPKPTIEDSKDVIVKVRACALNHLDIWARRGRPGLDIPLPHISGSDIAGDVVEFGRRVKGLDEGQKVLIYPGVGCNTCVYCTSNRDSSCRDYKILGYQLNGGYAEYVKVTENNIFPFPESLSYEEAATLPLDLVTSWHMLVSRAKVEPAETVLVWSAGSGVGTFAIQIAKIFGATVITTVGEDWKIEHAKKLGADFIINYKKEDLLQTVRSITKERGTDIVLDHVGESTWERSIKSLAPLGRLVTCGATSGYQGTTDIRYVFSKQLSILGSYMGSRSDLYQALKFVQKEKIRPVLDKVFDLREVAIAQKRMEESKHFGKVVLSVS